MKRLSIREKKMAYTISINLDYIKKIEDACAILGITNYSQYIRILIDDDVVQSIRRKVKIDYYMGGGK